MPIFMIGTQRSGSNLLRLMLNQLPEVAAPHPPHILQRMTPLLPDYGDLSDDGNFLQLIDDVCRLVELNPVSWEGVLLERNDIFRRCRTRSLAAIHGAVYDACAELQGALTWCCKSLANIQYTSELESYFVAPKYIYLYRDGRDVAVSFSKAVVGEKHFYHIAREWTATQELALSLRKRIEKERFLSVSYEELTTQTERTARLLCAFLGVAFCESMLEYHGTEEAKRAASSSDLWRNVTNPVLKHNSGKFMYDATWEEIEIFESVAGHVLDALGYNRSVVPLGQEKKYTPEDIRVFDRENDRKKEALRKLVDPADIMRRDLQSGLLTTVRERLARRKEETVIQPDQRTANRPPRFKT